VSPLLMHWLDHGLLLYFQSCLCTAAEEYGMLADLRYAVDRIHNTNVIFHLLTEAGHALVSGG